MVDIAHGKELYTLLKNPLNTVWMYSNGNVDILIRIDDQIYILIFLENYNFLIKIIIFQYPSYMH